MYSHLGWGEWGHVPRDAGLWEGVRVSRHRSPHVPPARSGDASPAASIGLVRHMVAIGDTQPGDLLCAPVVGEQGREEAVTGSGAMVTDVHLPGICWGIFLSAGCECATRQSHLPHSHFWESWEVQA